MNGNSLVQGLLALVTILSFQYLTSLLASRMGDKFVWVLQGPPLLIVFRGEFRRGVIKKHRISHIDVYAALRQKSILNVYQIEAAIIEPNGTFSVFTKKLLEEQKVDPQALTIIESYRKCCKEYDEKYQGTNGDSGSDRNGEAAKKTDIGGEDRKGHMSTWNPPV